MKFNNSVAPAIFLFLASVLSVSPLFALDDTAISSANATQQPATDTSQQKKFLGLDYSGYMDGSYNYLMRSNQFSSGDYDRVYDLNQNGFTLQQAALTLSHQPATGFGALANVILGRDANETAPLGINPQSTFDSENFGFTPVQAYLQYARGKFTLMAGQFLTIAGEEDINPTQDVNFSRSIIFYSEPYTHLGFRGVYVVSDKLTLTAGINDGWDNITDFSRRKTLEFGASCTLNPLFSFSLQGYSGQERASFGVTSGPVGQRTLLDFYTTLNATSKLSFTANYNYAWQTRAALPNGNLARAGWQGIAGYVNYKLNDIWQGSFRGEIFDDQNGFITGVRQNWRELTLSVACTPIKNLELRAETRHDFSDVSSFVNTNGVTTNNNNQSFALEGFYQF